MTDKSGGFWITSSSMEPGETCSLLTAPWLPVTAASDSVLEFKELQRDTPPVQSPTAGPLLTPEAAMHLEETHEAEEAAQGHPGRELLNKSFMFREFEQLTEECRVQEAAQLNTIPD